jgi:hypothetical protein
LSLEQQALKYICSDTGDRKSYPWRRAMKLTVVYDSVTGNTKQAAEWIAQGVVTFLYAFGIIMILSMNAEKTRAE